MAYRSQMSDADTFRVIREVKKRGCIWNTEDEDYGERLELATAWDEIAKVLNIPEDIARIKWKNLRDFFKKEVRKNDVHTVDDYGGRWRYFKSLGFLLRPDAAGGEGDGGDEGEEGDEDEQSASEKDEKEMEDYEAKYVPDSNLEVFIDEQDPLPEKRPRLKVEEDFDMMFLKSLTPFLKQLEPTRNLVVRSRIQDMLLNEIAAQKMSRNKKS